MFCLILPVANVPWLFLEVQYSCFCTVICDVDICTRGMGHIHISLPSQTTNLVLKNLARPKRTFSIIYLLQTFLWRGFVSVSVLWAYLGRWSKVLQLHCTLYTAQCTLHTLHCTLMAVYCTLHTALRTEHYTLNTTYCIAYCSVARLREVATTPPLGHIWLTLSLV